VRSSATAEDLPDASFAGQQETFLNIHGYENILHAMKEVFASLYNDRAIAYRVHKGFAHADVALSAGVQRMVRSDSGASGVMFTIDTESGFDQVVFITASYGLGETVVQGAVNPDEFYVHKPMLARASRRDPPQPRLQADQDGVHRQGRGRQVGAHGRRARSRPQPLLAHRRRCARTGPLRGDHREALRPPDGHRVGQGRRRRQALHPAGASGDGEEPGTGLVMEKYRLKQYGKVLTHGRAIGQKIGAGVVRVVSSDASEMNRVQAGDVLVTDMTDPNWEPVMKRAAAIVTNRGGRTCHAAIIARELGIPAIVGCGNATDVLHEGESSPCPAPRATPATSIAASWSSKSSRPTWATCPIPVKIMMNVGNPELAFEFAQMPNAGVGLARLEFIINNMIGIHPKAILDIDQVPASLRDEILRRRAATRRKQFFVEKLVEGVATIAAAFYPKPVIVRLSDFKSNEYRKLLGGEIYEPEEENPMLGFRGASRYIAHTFRDCFELECAP
jgi:pyruvate,water dikinase